MRVMVTGVAKGGFGGALCLKLADKARKADMPIHIVACATGNRPLLQEQVDELRNMGAYVTTVLGDVSDPKAPERMMEEALDWIGGLDGLVSNAGVFYPPTPWTEMTPEHFDRFLNVNTRATWLLAKAAYPHLKKSKGSIVVTASMCGVHAYPNFGVYCVSKAALIGTTQWLAQAWAKDGIRVNVLAPGAVVTPLNEERFATEEGKEAYKRITSMIPLGRFGQPNEVGDIMAWLLGRNSAHVTGQTFLVDGGWMQSTVRAPRV